MTEQDIFNKLCAHAAHQQHRALDDLGNCVYRAPNGDKCFAGALIADEHYRPSLENNTCVYFDVAHALTDSGVPSNVLDFVRMMQQCHGISHDLATLKRSMLDAAGIRHLNADALDQITAWTR